MEVLADQHQIYEEEEAHNASWDVLRLFEVGDAVGDGTTEDDHIGEK